jgi:hypothetical protein
MRIFDDQSWTDIVRPQDWDYLSEILADLKQRAQSDPVALFEQVCLLAFGAVFTLRRGKV